MATREVQNGKGEFVGGDTREEAHRIYRNIIEGYQSTHERHYQRKSGQKLSIPGHGDASKEVNPLHVGFARTAVIPMQSAGKGGPRWRGYQK